MVALSRHERPSWEEATMTAPANVEGCESELSRSVQCRKGFLRELGFCFSFGGMWRISLPAHLMCDLERRERERDSFRRVILGVRNVA